MRALEVVIRELARSEVSVLLLAEHGAGKHATAERIHQWSSHERSRPVVRARKSARNAKDDGRGGCFAAGTVYLEESADLTQPAANASGCPAVGRRKRAPKQTGRA